MAEPWDCSGHSFHQISLQSPQPEPYCVACGKIIEAETHGCWNCSGIFHKSCTELPKQIGNHFCHPQHPLTLYDSPPYNSGVFFCSACRNMTSHFIYYCVECEFCLDLDCAFQEYTIKFEDGEHLFVLVDKANSEHDCYRCRTTSIAPLFRCVVHSCFYNFHLHCVLLSFPETIEHKHHWHPLTFTESVPQDEEEGLDEFYCDICEKERNPKHPLYYCKECNNYFAHMACALSEVLPSLVADYESVCAKSSVSVADPIVAKLDIEIKELRNEKRVVKGQLSSLEKKVEVQTGKLKKVRAEIEELENKLAQHKSLSSQAK